MEDNIHIYKPNAEIKKEKLNLSISKYSNEGGRSKLINKNG